MGEQMAREEKVDLIILNQPERANFFRHMFGPMKESRSKRVTCPIEIVDEEVITKEMSLGVSSTVDTCY